MKTTITTLLLAFVALAGCKGITLRSHRDKPHVTAPYFHVYQCELKSNK